MVQRLFIRIFVEPVQTIQLVFKVGSFDVDDLFLNTIGGILGFLLYKIVQKIRIRRKLRARKGKL